MKRIAIDLNNAGVLSPQPQKGRVARSWCPSSIHKILHNERYRGIVTWGKTRKIRSPKGTRIYRRQPENQWHRMELADQRIVSDELWSQVRERMQLAQQLYGTEAIAGVHRGRAAGSPHIFTGLLVCSKCGGSVTIVSGTWKKREERYGCSFHAYRGNLQCTNSLLIKKSVLEKSLLAGLQDTVLHADMVRYTLKRFEKELTSLAEQKADSGLERRKAAIQKQIDNCTEAVAGGRVLRSLTEKIAALEVELADVETKIAARRPTSVRVHIRDARRYVEQRPQDIRAVLNGNPRVAREEIARHVDKIKLTPEGKHSYVATGTWDLLGWRRIPWCRGTGMHHASH